MKIFLPKTLHEIDWTYGPLFFLAGPIKGGGDWQYRACLEIRKYIEFFHAAIPCRYGPDHALFKFQAEGGFADHFARQTFWEGHYLELAATCKGCIIFWMPCEGKENPRADHQPYARDTYGEVGEWRGRLMSDPKLKVVFGAEPGFPGLEVMKRNFERALKRKDFTFHTNLVDTVRAAVELAQK